MKWLAPPSQHHCARSLACSKSWSGRWDGGGGGGALDRRWEFHGTVGPGRHGAVTRRVLCGDTSIPASPRLEDLMQWEGNVVMGGISQYRKWEN